MKKEGIVIIATRSHIYGRMAYNLALTIKATGTKVPVCLIHDSAAVGHLNEEDMSMFDDKVALEWDWNRIRFSIDKLSPYEHTLQLDADVLWLYRDPAELFKKYESQELLVTNEGYHDLETDEKALTKNYGWLADFDEAVRAYNLKGKVYQMRWEALLFKKTDNVRAMFKKAESIWKKPKISTWKFEGKTVDEFCFYVACNQLGLDQAASPFLPVYWCKRRNNPSPATLSLNGHYAVGFGGSIVPDGYRDMYDILMINAVNKLGLKHKFKLQSKRTHIRTRI